MSQAASSKLHCQNFQQSSSRLLHCLAAELTVHSFRTGLDYLSSARSKVAELTAESRPIQLRMSHVHIFAGAVVNSTDCCTFYSNLLNSRD